MAQTVKNMCPMCHNQGNVRNAAQLEPTHGAG